MSRRERVTDRSLWSITDLENARQRVDDSESIRSVARSLEVNEATLRKRLKRVTPATSLGRYNTTFSPEMEQELCEYIKKVDGMFYGLTSKRLRELAFQFAEQNKIPHRFNAEEKNCWQSGYEVFVKDIQIYLYGNPHQLVLLEPSALTSLNVTDSLKICQIS